MNHGTKVKADSLRRFLGQVMAYNTKIGANDFRRKMVPCVWGAPGIGKTTVIKQLQDENTVVIDVPLAQFEEMGDLHGMPRRVTKNGVERTEYAPPDWVPAEGTGKKYILLFDDWNRADIRIIKGIMQLLQNYGTVSWKLPASCTIMLTGNKDDGEMLVTAVDTAIITRIKHIELEADPLVWAEWARESDQVDDRVIAFVLKYKEHFCPKGVDIQTNPRTLTEFGEFLKGVGNTLNDVDIALHARSTLDEATSIMFGKFIRDELHHLIDPKKILDGDYDPTIISKLASIGKTDIIHMIVDRLYVEVGATKRTDKKRENFENFMTQQGIPKDMVMAVVQRLTTQDKKQEWVRGVKLSVLASKMY